MGKTCLIASTNKSRTMWMLIIQLFIFIATAITAVSGFLYGASSSQDGDNMIGPGYFKAFTMDSNILAGVCALVIVCFIVRNLLRKENAMPQWVIIFHHVTATGLFLTFVTVVFFLAPMDVLEGKSYLGMFSNDLFLYHLINPVLAIGSFVYLQRETRLQRKDSVWTMIPVVIYIIVYFLMVVVFHQWNDFYGFTFGGQYFLAPVAIVVMLLLTWVLGRLLIRLNSTVQDNSVSYPA